MGENIYSCSKRVIVHFSPLIFSQFRSHSGSGHSGYGHSSDYFDCCPLVIDPTTLCALLAAMATLGWILWRTINLNMVITMLGRRRRRSTPLDEEEHDLHDPAVVVSNAIFSGKL